MDLLLIIINTFDALLDSIEIACDVINKYSVFIAVYLDFSKAIDTMDHQILLEKLEFYGLKVTSLQWIRSFLTNRKQINEINNARSSSLDTNIGVSQDLTLGPLQSISYINNFKNSFIHLKSIHFPDCMLTITSIDHANLMAVELAND